MEQCTGPTLLNQQVLLMSCLSLKQKVPTQVPKVRRQMQSGSGRKRKPGDLPGSKSLALSLKQMKYGWVVYFQAH